VIKKLLLVVAALWLLPPAGVVAQDAWRHGLAEDTGVIQGLDFAAQTMVIDGMDYTVAVDVKVEIGGSFGAFTMLQSGMRVYYEFRQISESSRLVTLIRELPGNVALEEV